MGEGGQKHGQEESSDIGEIRTGLWEGKGHM